MSIQACGPLSLVYLWVFFLTGLPAVLSEKNGQFYLLYQDFNIEVNVKRFKN